MKHTPNSIVFENRQEVLALSAVAWMRIVAIERKRQRSEAEENEHKYLTMLVEHLKQQAVQ